MLGWFSSKVFLGAAQRRLIEAGLPVFTYHKIAAPLPPTTDPFLYVSPARFDAQLAALTRAGYQSASLTALASTNGGRPRAAVITFDDGCVNVLQHGLDILARHHFRAIQFLVAGSLGRTNQWDIAKGDASEGLMDESQVRQWLAAGHEIGSHSMTHRNLRHVNPQELREEIVSSKKLLEDRFGVAVQHFCYPYGSYNEAVRACVAEAGYRSACTVTFGINSPGTPNYEVRRIIPLSSTELLAKILHRLRRKFR